MLIVTKFDVDADIIDAPLSVIEHAEDLQEQFFKWLFDKNVNHSYWWYENGLKFGCSYRSNAFIEWLNAFPLKNGDEKATIISTHVAEYDKTLPSLFF